MSQSQSKNQKIQILRAIAICCVVMGHSYPFRFRGVLIRTLINFTIPLFFFLSGYLTKLEYDDWGRFWLKRIRRIFIPYAVWSVIWTVISHGYDHFIFKLLTGKTLYPYYFVFVYCQFVLFTPLMARLAKSRYRWVGWLIQPLAIYLRKYCGLEQVVPFYELFSFFGAYYLGLALGNHVLQWNYGYKKTGALCAATFILSALEGIYWYRAGNYDLATNTLNLTNYPYSMACLLLAHQFLTDDGIVIRDTAFHRMLITLGDCSFGIFLIHAYILMIMQKLPVYHDLVFPLNSAIAVLISWLCIFCGRKIFGEKYGKYFGFY